jgi:polysaccharide biosynthesis transport protein
MSFGGLLELIRARRRTFLLVFSLIVASTIGFCLLATPIYQSNALLMISADRLHARGQPEYPDTLRDQINSQIYILQSEDVLRAAIGQIGPQTLSPYTRSWIETIDSIAPNSARSLFHALIEAREHPSETDQALVEVQKRLSVSAEAHSQVLSVTFRHQNPQIAERFLGLIINVYLQRQAYLSGNAAAPSFFEHEVARYRADYEKASAKLLDFTKQHSTFSISQQTKLALERRDDTVATLAKTHGLISQKEAEAASLQNALSQLRAPIAMSPAIVGPNYNAKNATDAPADRNRFPGNAPPLGNFNAEVSLKTGQTLLALNSEIVGLRALEASQSNSLSDVDKTLFDLSSTQAEFDRLRSDVEELSRILQAYVQRTAEAQMDADQDASEELSKVRIVQAATKPIRPVSPPIPILIALGTALGLFAGAAAVLAVDSMALDQQAATSAAKEIFRRQGSAGALPSHQQAFAADFSGEPKLPSDLPKQDGQTNGSREAEKIPRVELSMDRRATEAPEISVDPATRLRHVLADLLDEGEQAHPV